MSEEYLYEYDVIVKMKVKTKEDLSDRDVMKSIETALWGIKLTTLTGVLLTDLHIVSKKKQGDKDISV